jgi:DegV family protein with EDD domain
VTARNFFGAECVIIHIFLLTIKRAQMKKIAIITDTDSSLPPAVAERYGIRQVPITIHFETESYTTGVDIDDGRLFEKIDRINKLPTTAAPAPSAFATAFESAFQEGADAIVCICVSSKVSATYGAALSACEAFAGRDISVIDSLSMSMGQGFMAIAAAEAALAGASKEQVMALAEDTGRRVVLFAALSTLKYLALGGRVGKLAAGFADTLNIKPVLTIRDGKLDLLERIRTRRKAVDRMIELTAQALGGKRIERAAIIHVTDPIGAQDLHAKMCASLLCPDEVITAEFTPGLSVHAGSGVVGLAVVTAGM